MSLTREKRDALPETEFAVPGKRKLPMHDATHARLAWDMVDRTSGLSPEERSTARSRILRRAKELNVDTTDWHAEADISFQAMAIEMPHVDGHPNRKPFKGILTRVDEPSDEPPGGSTGKRVMIPAAVAEAAIPSLLGMAVDCDPDGDFAGHDPQFKIGIITGAKVVGNALEIAGFFYANDFPELWEAIDAEKHKLGFSYEVKVRIRDMDADIWVVDSCVFTGAALLYKSKAAYHTTSLAAKAEKEDAMTAEELKALNESIAALTASVATIGGEVKELKAKGGASLSGPIVDQVAPHVAACMACADAMSAAGVGDHPTAGHAVALRHIANHLAVTAAAGSLPHIYRDHDFLASGDKSVQAAVDQATKTIKDQAAADLKASQDAVAALTSKVTDLEAKAFKTAAEPERKTASPEVTALLTKIGLSAEGDKKLTVADADKALAAAGITGSRAIAAKLSMRQTGVLA